MAYNILGGFPSQQLSFRAKNKTWRKKVVDFADKHSFMHYHVTRKSVKAMQINYDLLRDKIHMDDLALVVNPFHTEASYIPDNIQHYPIINSKLEVLKGEESRRLFDYRVVITNPSAISEMEKEKNELVNQRLQELIMDTSQSEEDFQKELQKQSDYFTYEYQDKREIRANLVLNHYSKELDLPILFNEGFEDAECVGEELYHIDIVGGEPYVEKLNPREVRIIRSGTSTRVEDADMIIIEQYWNPGKIVTTYYDQLTKQQINDIENGADSNNSAWTDSMANRDPRYGFVPREDFVAGDEEIDPLTLFSDESEHNLLPYDLNGNVRVLRVYWISRRKIKKVKSYDPETGEEVFNFYDEDYKIDPNKGEEEKVYWINQAWGGTKIGKDIYVDMGPRPIQYNRLSNPSKCHLGVIGSIYSSNGETPFSLVDIMKPYAYLYDVVHDRLNKTLARNIGKAIKLDFAKTPKGWEPDEWLYYLHTHGIVVEDSAKEGEGIMAGKPVGSLNNASTGVVDASLGQEITQYINYLEWISNKVGELAGISKQREGQISNRETVGGVERATLQSSHSTEWLFIIHESVKKRVLECLLETAKIAFKGRKIKFDNILSDGSKLLVEFDGDEFAECDYGLVVDNSNGAQQLNQQLEGLAQAGLQNNKIDFSTMMKIFTTTSMAEKQRIVENCEKKIIAQQQQEMQQQMQLKQQEIQTRAAMEQQKAEMEYKMHQEKLEADILIAQINSVAEQQRMAIMNHDNDETSVIEREKIAEQARQFNAKLQSDERMHKDDIKVKEKQIAKQSTKK